MATTLFHLLRTRMPAIAFCALPLLMYASDAYCQLNATWLTSPSTNDWRKDFNWDTGIFPDGLLDTATFGVSNATNVLVSEITGVGTDAASITFAPGASPYTLTVHENGPLRLSGAGVVNDSGVTQNFVVGNGTSAAFIQFSNSASAGSQTMYETTGGTVVLGQNGQLEFLDDANAGTATFINHAPTNSTLAIPGRTALGVNASAANGTFINHGGVVNNRGGGETSFSESATAANGHFTNHGGVVVGSRGGETSFSNTASAGNATLVANGGVGLGGRIAFAENSVGGNAHVEVYDNGFLDVRPHNSSVTIASIAGDGRIYLGDSGLNVGVDDSDSTFAGTIEPGPVFQNETFTLGTLTKVGTGTLTLTGVSTNSSTIVNGGLLRITGGGTVSNQSPTDTNPGAAIGSTVGSTGAAVVDGTGSLWSGDLAVGRFGSGELSVLDGGALDNANLSIGRNAGSDGTVTIDGVGSVSNSGSVIVVGERGNGTLNLQNGGVIHVNSGDVTIGEHSGSSGILNIGTGGAAGTLDAFQVRGLLGSATLNFNHSESSHYFTRDGLANGVPVNIFGNVAVNQLGSGTTIVPAATNYTGDTSILAGTLSIQNPFLSNAADIHIADGATFDLNFNGTDVISSLFIDGNSKLVGTHGAIGSGADFEWSVITGTGLLRVTSLLGDFDHDGDVDGRDFLIWQRGGSPAAQSSSDLADWQANYGVGSLAAISSVAVPEPNQLLLLVTSGFIATFFGRKGTTT